MEQLVDTPQESFGGSRDLQWRPAGLAHAKAWVERVCAEQDVSVKTTDPLAVAEIAEILLAGREKLSSSER